MDPPSLSSDVLLFALPFIASLPSPPPSSFFIAIAIATAMLASFALLAWSFPGGGAWGSHRLRRLLSRRRRRPTPPGPRGIPIFGSLLSLGSQAHRTLASISSSRGLIALSLASTRLIVSSSPASAKEILCSPSFSDRPLKNSARHLLFHRAIGFAPHGDYWRKLRRIAATHLFSPRSIASREPDRLAEIDLALDAISSASRGKSSSFSSHPADPPRFPVVLRSFLQQASLNNIMFTVFGRRYDFLHSSGASEATALMAMVREGFELLGAFNLADHMPILEALDTQNIRDRCEALVPRVNQFVSKIIAEHRKERSHGDGYGDDSNSCEQGKTNRTDFVHVLLSLQEQEQLSDEDIIAILWEMIFRGTDSVSILLEWILAELVLNPSVQDRAAQEIEKAVGKRVVRDSDIVNLPYLQAIVHETLRIHPPGPLLSWARLAVDDAHVAGFHVPKGTTAMVNMWAISHDPSIWPNPLAFYPDRFLTHPIDIRGSDLRLAPFGAGRRVCPGRALGLSTVYLWLARLVQRFRFEAVDSVDLSECLKLSCEMVHPLRVLPLERSMSTSLLSS